MQAVKLRYELRDDPGMDVTVFHRRKCLGAGDLVGQFVYAKLMSHNCRGIVAKIYR